MARVPEKPMDPDDMVKLAQLVAEQRGWDRAIEAAAKYVDNQGTWPGWAEMARRLRALAYPGPEEKEKWLSGT